MNKIKFNVQIKEVEKYNPLFSKCKIYICYSDLNRNGSTIGKHVIENAIPSLYGCPILGEFNKINDDFMDHGGKIEITNEGELQYICTTMPYGFVPESSVVEWEMVDGKEYLTCTGFLWTSRYPEAQKAIEEGRPQSMEIDEVEGEFDSHKNFAISSFVFSGLTILGNDVEPCFEEAKIIAYNLNKDEFTKEFNRMLKELKESIQIQPTEHVVAPELNQEFKENNFMEDEIVKKTKKQIATQFSLTVNQLYEEIARALSQFTYSRINWWGEEVEVSRFYLSDFDDSYIYSVDRMNDYVDVKLTYSMSGDNVVIDFDSIKRIKYVPTDWDDGASDSEMDNPVTSNFALMLEKEFSDSVKKAKDHFEKQMDEKTNSYLQLNENFSALQKDLDSKNNLIQSKEQTIESLQSFKKQVEDEKRKVLVDELFSKFSKYLSKEEIDDWREKEAQFDSYQAFEKELKSFTCDRLVNTHKETKPEFSHISVDHELTDSKDEPETQDVWARLSK